MTGSHFLTIIADDLTGAADTSAPFAAAGFATTIVFGDKHPNATDVLVVTTNSRELAASNAARANRIAAEKWSPVIGHGERSWVYKKIDSAMRGHPAAELEAVMAAMGARKVLVASALPAEGRTTVGGRQYLDGIPLEDTAFGALGVTSDVLGLFDPHQDGRTILLGLATVRRGPEAIGQFLDRADNAIIVADAETNDDLAALAQAIASSDITLLAGTAGFASQLAPVLPGPRGRLPIQPIISPGKGVLVVAGSRDQITADQVDHLRDHGMPIFSLAPHHLDGHNLTDEIIAPLMETLSAGNPAVLTTVGLHSPAHGAGEVRERLATIVATPAIRPALGGLILTGGDVAMGVLQRLSVVGLQIGGEVRPALPWTIAQFADGSILPVVTKAGSFGEADALLACLHLLEGRETADLPT